LHPKISKSHLNCAQYAYIILYPKITSKAAELIIKKLIKHLQLLEDKLHLMQVENNNFHNNVIERRAKKKKKRVVLFTKLVLTTK